MVGAERLVGALKADLGPLSLWPYDTVAKVMEMRRPPEDGLG